MANAHRGDVGFEVGDQSYTLRYTINALCEMEGALGMGVQDFCRHLVAGDVRLTNIRAAFWAGLRSHHPDLSLAQAGDLLQKMGGAERALVLIGEAMALAFPAAVAGSDSRPQ